MQGEMRHERQLRRIIALLVAFAGLAERAADRSYPVRFVLLVVLRYAETIACGYVADVMLVDGLWFDDGMECTSSPDDAALLAERFRLLAAELVTLLDAPVDAAFARSRTGVGRPPRDCAAHAPAGDPAPRRRVLRAGGADPPVPHGNALSGASTCTACRKRKTVHARAPRTMAASFGRAAGGMFWKEMVGAAGFEPTTP
jgi:hypothetical protein